MNIPYISPILMIIQMILLKETQDQFLLYKTLQLVYLGHII